MPATKDKLMRYRNRDWLYKEYFTLEKTVEQISEEINVKNETIALWLDKLCILKRSYKETKLLVNRKNPSVLQKQRKSLIQYYETHDHPLKGYTWDENERKRIGNDRRKYFSLLANRQKHSKILSKRLKNPETKKKMRNARLGIKPWNLGKTHLEDPRISYGKNHGLWKGGISFELYPFEFDKELKELIRHRDGYKCQLCGMPEIEQARKLAIHHINYNKKNCKPSNLISLCNSCNIKVNFDRNKWIKYFQRKIKKIMNSNMMQLNFKFKQKAYT